MNYTKNEKCQFILEDVLNTLEEEPDKIEDFTNVLALLPQARNIPVTIHGEVDRRYLSNTILFMCAPQIFQIHFPSFVDKLYLKNKDGKYQTY